MYHLKPDYTNMLFFAAIAIAFLFLLPVATSAHSSTSSLTVSPEPTPECWIEDGALICISAISATPTPTATPTVAPTPTIAIQPFRRNIYFPLIKEN